MKALRASVLAAAAAAALAGCGASAPAGVPGSAPAASGTPAASTAVLYLEASEPVPFAGDVVRFTVQAAAGPGVPRWLRLRSVTVSFGDGASASARQPCTGHHTPAAKGLPVRHLYRRPGAFTARVTSAAVCGETGSPGTSGVTAAMRVLPAAPAGSAAWPRCTQGEVRVSARGIGAGLGHVGVLFTLRNASAVRCRLLGWPGLRLLGRGGNALPTTVHDAATGTYLFPPVAPHRVALAPGGYAAFELEYEDNPSGAQASEPYSVACPSASSAGVSLPGARGASAVGVTMAPCGGDVWVSPVIPGRAWVTFP
jgi:hypothetical protein